MENHKISWYVPNENTDSLIKIGVMVTEPGAECQAEKCTYMII